MKPITLMIAWAFATLPVAKAPEGSISAGLEYPSPATPNHPLFLMLRSLLEDRFQLKAHPQTR
jgi:uncharacterized protein (TIGR03435 family)